MKRNGMNVLATGATGKQGGHVARLLLKRGHSVHAGSHQPLFHVEHAVGGVESRPLNLWRIVHLTTGKDHRLMKRFAQMGTSELLPEFIAIYIERDLRIKLTHL